MRKTEKYVLKQKVSRNQTRVKRRNRKQQKNNLKQVRTEK